MVTAALAVTGAILPNGLGSAAQQSAPTLKSLVAQARQLASQISTLTQQYDGLRIQLAQARSQEKIAGQTAARDAAQLGAGQAQVGQLAAESYMNGNVDPTLQLISSSNPQMVVSRAAIMLQLNTEKSVQVSALAVAENAARRARQTARQQASVVSGLVHQMQLKTSAIRGKISKLNGAAFKQAMAIFTRTGQYPAISVPGGNSIGAQALRYALSRRGDPYVWGAAGPNAFDCSGLVMWAYAQVGIHLAHFTGYQWNEGQHISRSQLQPGDLVFFFADISHVGLYIGNGLMVDASTFGQPVTVQPVFWSAFVGAVRIVA